MKAATKRTRGRPKKHTAGITDAAEYLWAVFDEFKAKDEAAADLMRDARVLLGVATDRAMAALRANVAAIARKGTKARGS